MASSPSTLVYKVGTFPSPSPIGQPDLQIAREWKNTLDWVSGALASSLTRAKI